jgi:hypothetical protein
LLCKKAWHPVLFCLGGLQNEGAIFEALSPCLVSFFDRVPVQRCSNIQSGAQNRPAVGHCAALWRGPFLDKWARDGLGRQFLFDKSALGLKPWPRILHALESFENEDLYRKNG